MSYKNKPVYRKSYQPIFEETEQFMKKIVDRNHDTDSSISRKQFGERKMNEMKYIKMKSVYGDFWGIPKRDIDQLILKYHLKLYIYQELSGFAEVIYNQKSPNEIIDALNRPADTNDMRTWKISEEDYYDALTVALANIVYETQRITDELD